jgi:dimethylglycine dehydrogenase
MDGIDPDFTQALCPSDLDRCLDNMEHIFERLPALTEAGIHTVINGPITYTIDGAPLIGPIPGLENAYCAIGLRAGIGESGGHGKLLAEMIVHGECEWDAWFLDPRRFTQYANTEHTCLKAIEDYQNEFHYHTTPLYPVLDQLNCTWGVVNGWERALFFKPDAGFVDEHSYRFTPTKAVVATEVEHLQQHVSIMEVSGFNRYEISGNGVEEFLDQMICGRLPTETGKLGLCYLLTEKGNILSEATLVKLGENRYWWGSAAAGEWHDRDWLNRFKPESVTLTEMANSHTILVVAGPKSRALLQSVSPRCDWSKEAFPWLRSRQMFIGHAEVTAMSVSFSGELAYELHVPNEQPVDLGYFGLYATESMRLEKGYLHWKSDLIYEHNPLEARLDRFVKLDKASFIGKRALLEQIERGPRKLLVSMTVDCDIASAHGGDPVFADDQQVGSVTSAGYGHRVAKNIAYAYVNPAAAAVGTRLSLGILGDKYDAVVVDPILYDPENQRVRS